MYVRTTYNNNKYLLLARAYAFYANWMTGVVFNVSLCMLGYFWIKIRRESVARYCSYVVYILTLFVISVLCTLYSCHVDTYEALRDQCPVYII